MALQTILKKSYIEKVFDEVNACIELNRFKEDKFPFEEEYLLVIPQVNHPEGLLSQLEPSTDGDFKTATSIYNAFSKLTPLQANNSQFWDSLSLTDLFPYMQSRWGIKEIEDEDKLKKTILNHFSVKTRGVMRHGLGGLWWLVYLTVDNERDNRFELTEMLFRNYTLRYVRFGAGKVIQHKEAAIGILQYIKDNEKYIKSMENVANGMTSYFNKLGAVKQLTFLDRHFFYNEMDEHIMEFMNTPTKNTEESDETDEL